MRYKKGDIVYCKKTLNQKPYLYYKEGSNYVINEALYSPEIIGWGLMSVKILGQGIDYTSCTRIASSIFYSHFCSISELRKMKLNEIETRK